DGCREKVRAALPDGTSAATASKCESARLKAAGKAASRKLGCYAKAARKGLPVDSSAGGCLDKAHAKFVAAFDKVTGCTGDGQADAVETLIDVQCVHQPVDADGDGSGSGFSTGASILVRVPGVDLGMTGAAPITDIARSLDADAPIVLVNAATGEHHLMFAEIDANATSEANRAVIIHPSVNLAEATRYIVALRRMKDSSG